MAYNIRIIINFAELNSKAMLWIFFIILIIIGFNADPILFLISFVMGLPICLVIHAYKSEESKIKKIQEKHRRLNELRYYKNHYLDQIRVLDTNIVTDEAMNKASRESKNPQYNLIKMREDCIRMNKVKIEQYRIKSRENDAEIAELEAWIASHKL